MNIGVFGACAPLGVLAARGIVAHDVSLRRAAPHAPVDRFVEPFMDPFAWSILRGLGAGALDDFGAIIFLRESPGALHAFHYAKELARRGVIGPNAPEPVLLNLIPSGTERARRFNLSELDRVEAVLRSLGWAPTDVSSPEALLRDVLARQGAGQMGGAEAFECRLALTGGNAVPPALPTPRAPKLGARLALLGAPMGGAGLHQKLDQIGALIFDQQAAGQREAARDTLEGYAANPWAARQPKPLYLDALRAALTSRRIEHVFWQVDPHDDLWGWLWPQVQGICTALGCKVTNLGFLPRWPTSEQLDAKDFAG